METNKKKVDNIDVSLIKVKEMVEDIRYGNVTLIIQDGKIIGELNPGPYVSGDKERHEKIRSFLEEMGW